MHKNKYFAQLSKLNSKKPHVRSSGVEALSTLRERRIVGPLSRRLFDKESKIRERVLEVLRGFGLDESLEALVKLYKEGVSARADMVKALSPLLGSEMPAPHHAVIVATALGLHELYEQIAVLSVRHEEKFVRRAAMEGLYQCNQPSLAPTFILPVVDNDPMVRKYAAVGMAENGITFFSHNLRRDEDKKVREAAQRAFREPGQLILVKDPHRHVMEKSKSFTLPDCGSAFLEQKQMPLLTELGKEYLSNENPNHIVAALLLLRELGHDITELLEAHKDLVYPLIRRFQQRERIRQKVQKQEFQTIPILKGKRVLVLGGDGQETKIQERLTRLGLDVVWRSGFDNRVAKDSFQRLDAVIIIWGCVSHAAAGHGLRIADMAEVPVTYSRSGEVLDIITSLLDAST